MRLHGLIATACEVVEKGGGEENSAVDTLSFVQVPAPSPSEEEEAGNTLCFEWKKAMLIKRVAHQDAVAVLTRLVNENPNDVASFTSIELTATTLRISFSFSPLLIPHILLREIAPYSLPFEQSARYFNVEDCFALTAQQRKLEQASLDNLPQSMMGELQALPDVLILFALSFLSAKDLKQVRRTSIRLLHCAKQIQPALLRTKLFPHQMRSLNLMEQQEMCPPSFDLSLELAPNCFMDIGTGALSYERPTPCVSKRGGLFCDQPGLGKTCTMLALVLRNRGMLAMEELNQISDFTQLREKRRSPSRSKLVEKEERLNSLCGVKTTLLIVPKPLVPHWQSQIALHAPALVVQTVDDGDVFPTSVEQIASLDILLVSLGQISLQARLGANSFLTSVLFLRCVIDEGHSLGMSTQETNYTVMLRELRCERTWIMTGTPAKMTNKLQSLRSLNQILSFLIPANGAGGGAMKNAFEFATKSMQSETRPWGAYVLSSHLLKPILIRHTKEEIVKQLPRLERTSTLLDLTAAEKRQYNLLVSFVRSNLTLTKIGNSKAGWDASLLNPIHRARAMELVELMRMACTAGTVEAYRLGLSQANKEETMHLFAGESEQVREQVAAYLQRAAVEGETTRCGKCNHEYDLVLVSRCGHFMCTECFDGQNALCAVCEASMDLDDFAYIQPGFSFNRYLDRSAENAVASKAQYLIQRIEEARATTPNAKFIVFSQLRRVLDYLGDWLLRRFGEDSVAEFWGNYRKYELEKFNTGRVEVWKCAICGRMNHDMAAKSCGLPVAVLDTGARVLNPLASIENWAATPVIGSMVHFLNGVTPAARLVAVSKCRGRRAKALLVEERKVQCDILLLSRDGSVGLDISSATHVFLTEYLWDAALEDQIISRAWRLGNRAPVVYVEQLIMRNTVEDVLKQYGANGAAEEAEGIDAETSRIKTVMEQVRLVH